MASNPAKRKAAAPAVVSLWSRASAAAKMERDAETVHELKSVLQQDILVADTHGEIIPTGGDLPASSTDEPILVFPVAELDTFLSDRSLPIGWTGLRSIARPGQSSTPEQILIWICMGDRVVNKEARHPVARSFSALFAAFCGSAPERAAWQHDDALLFWTSPTFPQGLALDAFMVRSIQKGGNRGYLHAPVLLQHYLVVMGSKRADHKKVDISKYLRNNITGAALQQYLQGHGGSSLDVLTSIASLQTSFDISSFVLSVNPANGHAALIEKRLRENGPALISMFKADAGFLAATTATFREADFDSQTVVGLHAMVLLGIRPDAQEGHMCLVQNWHAGAELLEMSLPYLAATGCQITFVIKSLIAIPANLPQISAPFTEAMSDVVGESAPREQLL